MNHRSLALVLVVAGCPGDDATGEGETGGDASSSGATTTGSSSTDDGTASSPTSIDPDESDATTEASVCGDATIEGAEVCDDGNTLDGDGCSADCTSAVCLVPVTHATIQAGVDDDACPTVWIAGGEYHEFVDVARDVELVGSGPVPPVVDAMGLGRPFDVAAAVIVTLRGLEIAGGSADLGGAIRSHGTLTLAEVVVRDSRVEGTQPCGGAIWSDGALVLVGSTIRDNESALVADDGTASGGGLCIAGGSASLEASTLTRNVARANGPGSVAAQGGAIFATQAAVATSRGTTLVDNAIEIDGAVGNAIGSGGAMRQQGGTFSASDCVVADNRVVLSGAAAPGATLVAEGGGLAWAAVDGTGTAMEITGNTVIVEGTGDVIARGGGLRLSGLAPTTLALADIAGNAATATGDVALAEGGGAWLTLGAGARGQALALELVDTRLSDNVATAIGADAQASGAGLRALAVGDGTIVVRIDHSAVTGNAASGETSGQGGGLALFASADAARIEVAIVDATLSGDVADTRGGAIAASAVPNAEVIVRLRSATITACTADEGGGAWIDPTGGTVLLEAASSAVISNLGAAAPDCAPLLAELVSLGHTAVGAMECTLVGDGSELVGVDPLLAPLGDNGGPTPTHALDPASPLRNAGAPAGCIDDAGAVLATDQRHEDRHGEGVCDIGAYELAP